MANRCVISGIRKQRAQPGAGLQDRNRVSNTDGAEVVYGDFKRSKLLAKTAFEAHCKVGINLRGLLAIASQCYLDSLYTAVEVAAADV